MQNKKFVIIFVFVIVALAGYFGWRQYGTPWQRGAEDPFVGVQTPVDLDEPTIRRLESDIDNVKKMYAEKPNIWETWIAIGGLKNTLGDYDGAIAAYQKSLQITPNNILGLRNIAEVYRMGLKDYDKAVTYYNLAIKNNFADTDLHIALSQVYQYQLKNNDEAEKVLRDGLVRSPNHPDLLNALIAFYEKTGNRAKYEETVRKIRAAYPGEERYRTGYSDVAL